MPTTIQNLREISRRCEAGEPLDVELARWLGHSLTLFLERQAYTLEEAIGLHFGRGGVPWWLEDAMRRRDTALRELADAYLKGLSTAARARAIHREALRYAASSWRADRERREMPQWYAGTIHEGLWRAFKSGAPMPLGERQLRTILRS